MTKTTPRVRGTTPTASVAAKELRRNQTPAERVLWGALKGRKLDGLRFHQQYVVGPYVLDFYCSSRKRAIEVDGGIHDEQIEQDEYRDQQFANYGYRLLRFRNEEVIRNLPNALDRIVTAAHEQRTALPTRLEPNSEMDDPSVRDHILPQDWGAEPRHQVPDRSTTR